MKQYFKVLIIILATCSMTSSCVKDNFNHLPGDNGDAEVIAGSTHCNFTVNLRLVDSDVSTRGTDDAGTTEERKVTNLTLMFFDANNLKLEVSASFTGSQLVSIDGDKYSLKTAMLTTAGRKKVVALANLTPAVEARLANVKTYGQLKSFTLNSGLDRLQPDLLLSEMGVTSYNDAVPIIVANANNGLLMTGECEANIEGGVTESEALAGTKNNIRDLYLDRTMVKVRLNVPVGIYADIEKKYGLYRSAQHYYTPNLAIGNLPKTSYLMKRDNNISPYYNSLEYSNWQGGFRNYLSAGFDDQITDKNFTIYIPENTVADAMRGNVTYLKLGFKFTAYPNPRVISGLYVFYDEISDATKYYSGDATFNSNDINRFFDSKKVDYMEGQVLSAVCVMTTNNRTKEGQDAALKTALGVSTIPDGYYLFMYKSSMVDPEKTSEVWYDELQLYKYSNSGTKRENRRDFKFAFYDTNIWFRINLEDKSISTNSSKRYALKRNEFWTLEVKGVIPYTGKGFEAPGYPNLYDLDRRKGDKLIESGLGLDLVLDKWQSSGGNNVDIED